VEFIYGPCERTDESVKAIHVRLNPDLRAVPILKSVSETFNCKLLELYTGEIGDLGERTEASMKEFVELCRRMPNTPANPRSVMHRLLLLCVQQKREQVAKLVGLLHQAGRHW
jgi:hypothetical protein